MNTILEQKVLDTITLLRHVWAKVRDRNPFIAFSTGKDSLLVAALLYEAVAPERPICLYSHHDLEFECNLEYLKTLQKHFDVEQVRPHLNYFELLDRGISFLTLKDPWCVPMLVGTGILDWLQKKVPKAPNRASCFVVCRVLSIAINFTPFSKNMNA